MSDYLPPPPSLFGFLNPKTWTRKYRREMKRHFRIHDLSCEIRFWRTGEKVAYKMGHTKVAEVLRKKAIDAEVKMYYEIGRLS